MSVTATKGSLSSVLVRIERARTHLADFDMQARPVIAACKLTRAHDEDSSEYVFRISQVPPVPPVLSAIIGDAVHNLRVSLDYLAWQLVTATGTMLPNWATSFPLRKQPDANSTGAVLPDIKPGVSNPVRALLDEIQPYQRTPPTNHDLETLRALDNNDKHHDMLVTVVAVKDNMMGWWGDHVELTAYNSGPYSDGSEICRFRYTSYQADFEPSLRFDLGLRDPGAGPWAAMVGATDLVRRSLTYIEDEVLPRFRGFLGS